MLTLEEESHALDTKENAAAVVVAVVATVVSKETVADITTDTAAEDNKVTL